MKLAARLALFAALVLLMGLGVSSPTIAQTTVTYIHTDALGSVVAESDANGNVIKRYDYEPYGAVVGGQVTDGPGYTGHVSDSATGLSYMQQRYMDPQLGVFLSVDPVTAYDQPVGQFNRYRYANGNPYRLTDPDGRYAIVAEVLLIPVAVGTIYYFSTTPEQRQELGRDISRALKRSLQKSEAPKREPALVDGGPVVSDREPGSDGKRGSTGGPGASKRFPKESPEVKSEKEGIPCAYCGTSTTNTYGLPNSRERDHIDPVSRGGNNSPENERDACRTCNRQKGAKNPDEWKGR